MHVIQEGNETHFVLSLKEDTYQLQRTGHLGQVIHVWNLQPFDVRYCYTEWCTCLLGILCLWQILCSCWCERFCHRRLLTSSFMIAWFFKRSLYGLSQGLVSCFNGCWRYSTIPVRLPWSLSDWTTTVQTCVGWSMWVSWWPLVCEDAIVSLALCRELKQRMERARGEGLPNSMTKEMTHMLSGRVYWMIQGSLH